MRFENLQHTKKSLLMVNFSPAYQDTEDVMAYYRKDDHTRILVAANFGKESVELPLDYPVKQVLLSNQHSNIIIIPNPIFHLKAAK